MALELAVRASSGQASTRSLVTPSGRVGVRRRSCSSVAQICRASWKVAKTILSARALYLGSSIYRIHGSNEPNTIGQAVSSGCIRMTNEDVADLYDRVPVGAKVVVLR